jgi:hypothetical protein
MLIIVNLFISYDKEKFMRNRAERRHNDWHKAIRKQELYRCFMSYCTNDNLYDNLHQYSKNKIHISDAHGGKKTNNRGRKKYYGQGCKLWKASDLKKIARLKDEYELYI